VKGLFLLSATNIEIESSLRAKRRNPEGQKNKDWIASSLTLLAMTRKTCG
jgi:hypothetical protein